MAPGRKIVFFDIDGTLVSHVGKSHIPAATDQAVKLLRQAGHLPAVATARNLAMTLLPARHFGIDLLVCCDGAHVVFEGRSMYEKRLPDPFASTLRQRSSLAPEKVYALDEAYVYTGRSNREFIDYLIEQSGSDCRKPLRELSSAFLAYSEASPSGWVGNGQVDLQETPYHTVIRPRGVSKWNGIMTAAANFGFALQDCITVGDGSNDVEMLRSSFLGIAVGAAVDEAKAAADFIAADIDDGGIFDAFQTLGLI